MCWEALAWELEDLISWVLTSALLLEGSADVDTFPLWL